MDNDGIKIWSDRHLSPVFANMVDAIKQSKADVMYYYIAVSFSKNSIAMFEGLKGLLRSYTVAQSMRLLMEFTADMNFLINNPSNISRFKKDADKFRADVISGKRSWAESIQRAGNMHFFDEDSAQEVYTKDRVARVFNKKLYDFYCAYSHFNLYAICDDAENVLYFDEEFVKRANYQKILLIEHYPMILRRFIDSLNIVLADDYKIKYDEKSFIKSYNSLLKAISNAKIRRPNV